MLIAHLSDFHMRRPGEPALRVSPTNMLTERAINAVVALRPQPDVVIVTGDMSDCGTVDSYRLLARMLERVEQPVLMVPGNHDIRENLREGLPSLPMAESAEGFIQFVLDVGPFRLIGLDTVVPGKGEGALCQARLDFLGQALEGAQGRPVLIFMHHPPFDCGIPHLDRIRLLEGEPAFGALIRRHGNVERILCGHHHRPITYRYAGTVATTAPSVTHQSSLELRPEVTESFTFEPPAFQLHYWMEERGLVSHMAYVERYPGPYPYVGD